jgi:AAA domain
MSSSPDSVRRFPMATPAVGPAGQGTKTESSIGALIRYAKETKIPWTIEGLWQEGGIAIIHSLEGEFKSILSYQIAEAVATGSRLLRAWRVPHARRVGILETEMDDLEVGLRLGAMYPDDNWPHTLEVSERSLVDEFRKGLTLGERIACVDRWLKEKQVDVLVWDTINSILATGDPNSERSVSQFFDAVALLPLKGILMVRHDVKPSRDAALRSTNQLVRGSNRLVEDASLVIHLRRKDKAANKVIMEVGKLRNGTIPDPIELWFDAGRFRLTPLPPIVALLEAGSLSREELIEQAQKRFNLKQRAVDEHRAQLSSFVDEAKDGHRKILSLNYDFRPDPDSDAAKWWGLVTKRASAPR